MRTQRKVTTEIQVDPNQLDIPRTGGELEEERLDSIKKYFEYVK